MINLSKYIATRPGNYSLIILKNGMKLRMLDDFETEFKADYPECIDIKISNMCSIGCPYCHENSVPNGDYANPFKYKELLAECGSKSLLRGSEVALGGGALTELPTEFLEIWSDIFLKAGVITNLTINAHELDSFSVLSPFISKENFGGIGISYNRNYREQLLKIFPQDKVVIHTIAGITSIDDYKWLIENNFKILILGYKEFRRGEEFIKNKSSQISKNISELEDHVLEFMEEANIISFDNLACEQLHLKEKIAPENWEKYFMGNEGEFTMYMDLVKGVYAKNSTTPEENRLPIDFEGGIPAMFKIIRTNH